MLRYTYSDCLVASYNRGVLCLLRGTNCPTIIQVKSKKLKCTLLQALRLCTGPTAHRGSRGIALPFLDHGTRRGCGVSVTPRPLFASGKEPVLIVQEAGWAPGPVWTGAENIAPHRELSGPHFRLHSYFTDHNIFWLKRWLGTGGCYACRLHHLWIGYTNKMFLGTTGQTRWYTPKDFSELWYC